MNLPNTHKEIGGTECLSFPRFSGPLHVIVSPDLAALYML